MTPELRDPVVVFLSSQSSVLIRSHSTISPSSTHTRYTPLIGCPNTTEPQYSVPSWVNGWGVSLKTPFSPQFCLVELVLVQTASPRIWDSVREVKVWLASLSWEWVKRNSIPRGYTCRLPLRPQGHHSKSPLFSIPVFLLIVNQVLMLLQN